MDKSLYEQYKNSAVIIPMPCSVLEASGSDHIEFLHNLLSQDVASLKKQEWKEATLLSATSHILSYFSIIKADSSVLILSNKDTASSIQKNLGAFIITEDVEIKDLSESWNLFELWGKEALSLASTFKNCLIENHSINNRLRILCASEETISTNQNFGDQSLRELLRIENGILEYGVDMSEKIMLSETRLEKIAASETKGCYPGQEVVAKIETYKRLNRSFVKFQWDTNSLPEKDAIIYDLKEKKEIGCLTSRVYSTIANKGFGLGWLKRGFFETPCEVLIGSQKELIAKTSSLLSS